MKNIIFGIVVSMLSLTATQALAGMTLINNCKENLEVILTPQSNAGNNCPDKKPMQVWLNNMGASITLPTLKGCSYIVAGVGVGAECAPPPVPYNARATFKYESGKGSSTFCPCSYE